MKTGLWYASAHGFERNARAVIALARNLGQVEACLLSEAEDWLNENKPKAGHYWGWIDGDFGLWAVEQYE